MDDVLDWEAIGFPDDDFQVCDCFIELVSLVMGETEEVASKRVVP